MGEYAEYEIHREIFGCYPWEDKPTYGNQHGRQTRARITLGRRQYRGIKLYVNGRNGSKNNKRVRLAMESYCKEVLEWDNHMVNSTGNDQMAFEIGKDFNRFSTWYGVNKGLF